VEERCLRRDVTPQLPSLRRGRHLGNVDEKPSRGRHREGAAQEFEGAARRFDSDQFLDRRYGRMLQSPFTFYRGSAGVMAADLADTPGG
jgi:hypothetical protein